MDIYVLLVIVHVAGTILGVGGATMIEIALTKSLRDGTLSQDERAILGPTYTVVRVGLALALLSGFGFLILYKFGGQAFQLYDPTLWVKLIAVIVIAVNALLLQAHKISLYWGSALSFVSWWLAAILGIFLTTGVEYTFISLIFTYAFTVCIGAFMLHAVRNHVTQSQS
jgi:hypothetical protein